MGGLDMYAAPNDFGDDAANQSRGDVRGSIGFGRFRARSERPNKTVKKVIFLDVDGVLHSVTGREGRLRPDCLERLQRIVNETGAKLVVSSNWRRSPKAMWSLKRALKQYGMKIMDFTPVLGDLSLATRRAEILAWTSNVGFEGEWIALDDLNLKLGAPLDMRHRFIRTNAAEGLNANSEALAIAMLGRVNEGGDRRRPGMDSRGRSLSRIPNLYKSLNSLLTVR